MKHPRGYRQHWQQWRDGERRHHRVNVPQRRWIERHKNWSAWYFTASQVTADDIKFDKNDLFGGIGGENGKEGRRGGGVAQGRQVQYECIQGGKHGCYAVS